MKFVAALAGLSLAGMAMCQVDHEDSIRRALAGLSSSPTLYLRLDGTDIVGSRTNTISSRLFWDWTAATPNTIPRIDIWEFLNDRPSRRICGDGTTLWGYTNSSNSYTSGRYGAYQGDPAPNALADLLQFVSNESQGSTMHVTRLLWEIYGSRAYRTWLPGAMVERIDMRTTDPLSGKDYNPLPGEHYVRYYYGTTGPSRCIAFHISESDITKPPQLLDISYTDFTKVGSGTRRSDWTILVNPFTTETTNYKFVPPASARPVANRRSSNGG